MHARRARAVASCVTLPQINPMPLNNKALIKHQHQNKPVEHSPRIVPPPMADIAQNPTLNVIRDPESSDTHQAPGNSEHERSQSPQSSIADTPSSPPPPAEIERPSTPPQRTNTTPEATPRTPNTVRDGYTPSTPRTAPKSASVYLSSPTRRNRNHTNLLSSGVMTPGRPSLKMGGVPLPSSPYRPSRHFGGSFGSHLGGALSPGRYNSSFTSVGSGSSFSGGAGGSSLQVPASPSGRVQFDSKESLPSMPLQTLLMTTEQASNVNDLGKAKELLVLAIEQSEKFRKAAQQFRNHANNLHFQQKLSQIEREETEQRHEVESSIQQREIEKLVTDIMGYSDNSIGTDQIRRKLRKTKGRLKEMEDQLEQRDSEIKELKERMFVPPSLPNMPNMHNMPGVQGMPGVPPHMPAGPGMSGPGVTFSASQHSIYESPEKRRPPPIDTQLASEQSRTEPLSDLEVIASQVLSSGIQHKDHIPPPSSAISQPSPYQSPFYAPFSPFAVPPQVPRSAPNSSAQFGSPEKRRRPSSSSTISAMSEDDTLEE